MSYNGAFGMLDYTLFHGKGWLGHVMRSREGVLLQEHRCVMNIGNEGVIISTFQSFPRCCYFMMSKYALDDRL